MPFAQPTLGSSSGARAGATLLIGSLAPFIAPGFETVIGATIDALPVPGVNVIGTDVSAGFNAGTPPPGASMIVVTVAGTALTSRALIEVVGPAWARTHAELSITIEEWMPLVSRRGQPPRAPRLLQRITFNATKIFDDWGTFPGSFQMRIDDGTPFTSVAGMPVGPLASLRGHFFVCWINLIQSAETNPTLSFAYAVSNVAFAFPPPFFAFV